MAHKLKVPLPSARQENLEQALGLLWQRFEDGTREAEALHRMLMDEVSADVYEDLVQQGLIRQENHALALTPEGEEIAKEVTRRHRLAERLLTDVLDIGGNVMDTNACRLEHILSAEVTRSICTLLGHPRQCPHGSPIPSGSCCHEAEDELGPIVTSLDKLPLGSSGKIAYLSSSNPAQMHKLLSLGVTPGADFRLRQLSPSFVIEIGETQLALESVVAQGIFVRRA